jgi:hypothetical protein
MTDTDTNSLKDFENSVEDLYRSFPNLFRSKPVVSVMLGWHGLIADCAQEMQSVINKSMDDLPDEEAEHPRIVDIKEKYGSMRISLSGYLTDDHRTEALYDILAKYEERSMRTCEVCGRPGSLTRKGWIRCVCKLHE